MGSDHVGLSPIWCQILFVELTYSHTNRPCQRWFAIWHLNSHTPLCSFTVQDLAPSQRRHHTSAFSKEFLAPPSDQVNHTRLLFFLLPSYISYSRSLHSIPPLKNGILRCALNPTFFARSRFPVKRYPVYPLHFCLK